LLTTAGKLGLLFFTVDTRLDLHALSAFNNFFTTAHFISLFTAEREFLSLLTAVINFIATNGQLFIAAFLLRLLFIFIYEHVVSCFLRIH
jgi:hypothetical protein